MMVDLSDNLADLKITQSTALIMKFGGKLRGLML